MNDSTNQDILRLKQMLEEVTAADSTSPSAAAGEHHDAASASLREAWLAFGQLIRAADASLPPMPEITTSTTPQKRRRSRWLGLLAAAAATLLVAVTAGWWISRASKQGKSEPSLAQTVIPRQNSPQIEKKAAVALAQAKTKSFNQDGAPALRVAATAPSTGVQSFMTKSTVKSTTWDDPLATQIAAVSQQIDNVKQSWQHHVNDLDLVQYRIDEVTDSLQNDAL